MSTKVEKAEKAVSLNCLTTRVWSEQYKGKGLASFVNYVRERRCVFGVRAHDGDSGMVFSKSKIINGGF